MRFAVLAMVMSWGIWLSAWVVLAGNDPVSVARLQRDQAHSASVNVDARVTAGQAQLDQLSKQIETFKAQQQQNPSLFVPGQLDALLKQSQSESEALLVLQAEQARTHQAEHNARDELSRVLDARINEERASLSKESDPTRQGELAKDLRSLESERSSLSARVDAAPEAGSNPAAANGSMSDDPRELRERADALRDRADKLARQKDAIEARIRELHDRQELERQLSRFSREEALFDESDRRVSVSKLDAAAPALSSNPNGTPVGSRTTTTNKHDGTTPAQVSTDGVTPNNAMNFDTNAAVPVTAGPGAHIDGSPAGASPSGSELTPSMRSAQVVRPDDLSIAAQGRSLSDEESLPVLLKSKAQLEQELKQLNEQAHSLDEAAQNKAH
jgi:hypothetical protein